MNNPKEPAHLFDPQSFLNESLWAINEAVYVIAGWPKYNVCLCNVSPMPKNLEEHRKFFYLPEGNEVFNPEAISVKHLKVYQELRKCIDNGEIWHLYDRLSDGISFFLKPIDVVLWALCNGYTVIEGIQDALDLRLVTSENNNEAMKKKVKVKTIGQYLISEIPGVTVSELGKNPLMISMLTNIPSKPLGKYEEEVNRGEVLRSNQKKQASLIKQLKENVPTIVRNALNELFQEEGKPGRPSNGIRKSRWRQYDPKPILEVVQISSSGLMQYNFPLLKIVLESLVDILKSTIISEFMAEEKNNANQGVFQDKVYQNTTIQLYVVDSPTIVHELLNKLIFKAWVLLKDIVFWGDMAKLVSNNPEFILPEKMTVNSTNQ